MAGPLEEITDQIKQNSKLVACEDYEIAVQRLSSEAQKFRNGEGATTSGSESYWISLRILLRKTPGRAVTVHRTKEALGLLVDSAFESAKRSSVDPWFRFPLWKQVRSAPPPPVQDAHYASLYPQIETPPDLVEETYEQWDVETFLRRRSERFTLSTRKRVHSLCFSVIQRGPDSIAWAKEDRALARPLVERDRWLEALLRQCGERHRARKAPLRGKGSVLFSPLVVASLLRKLAPWLGADLVQSGKGPLAFIPPGDALVAPCLSLVDHGNLPDAAQSSPFDMEGSVTGETILIDRGKLRNFLHDYYTATKENRLSTGNFLRSPQNPHPKIATSNLYFKPGDRSPDQLLRSLDRGFLLEGVDRLELVPGEDMVFELQGPGWKVESGQCVEPVRDICIKLNLFEIFRRAVAPSNDLRLFGAYGSPSILFEDLPLGI